MKCAVNAYKRELARSGDKEKAAQAASYCLEVADEDRFLEVMLALELCGQKVL